MVRPFRLLTLSLLLPSLALAQTAPIKGQDVMGDKNRSGPDGFSWAPTPRTEAPSGQAPGESKSGESNAKGGPPTHLSAGQDPGTPATPTQGPAATPSH